MGVSHLEFEKIRAEDVSGNIFDRIGSQWMLITGGDRRGFNTMTASWGGAGVLWGKPVVTCYIRPQRYTKAFVDAGDFFTVSFYGEQYRPQLALCGSKSGRDVDKTAETGLTPAFSDAGGVYFEEAELVLVCKKLYTDVFRPENFLDPEIGGWYPEKDYHHIYIGEVVEVLRKKQR